MITEIISLCIASYFVNGCASQKIKNLTIKKKKSEEPVVVASWGGAYTESQKLGYGDPTAKELGINIDWINYSGGLSEIKAQKEDGKITWDIMDVFAMDTIKGCDQGLFVKFDFDKDFPPAPDGTPASQDFFAPMPSKCAVGNILYSWNYAYNVNNVKGTPKTIGDFFNTKKFPGKRAIYKNALTNLEIALIADGVKPENNGKNIYNLLKTNKGVSRAINKIKALDEDPKGGLVFWSEGAQPPELLTSGEVVMATGWNSRFFNAEVGKSAPIKQVWDGHGIVPEYFVQVKDGPNDANGKAKKALSMMTNTEMLARSAKYIGFAPYRISSLDIIEKGEPWYKDGKTNIMQHMPTAPANTKNFFVVDPIFWAKNGDKIGEQWEDFKFYVI